MFVHDNFRGILSPQRNNFLQFQFLSFGHFPQWNVISASHYSEWLQKEWFSNSWVYVYFQQKFHKILFTSERRKPQKNSMRNNQNHSPLVNHFHNLNLPWKMLIVNVFAWKLSKKKKRKRKIPFPTIMVSIVWYRKTLSTVKIILPHEPFPISVEKNPTQT